MIISHGEGNCPKRSIIMKLGQQRIETRSFVWHVEVLAYTRNLNGTTVLWKRKSHKVERVQSQNKRGRQTCCLAPQTWCEMGQGESRTIFSTRGATVTLSKSTFTKSWPAISTGCKKKHLEMRAYRIISNQVLTKIMAYGTRQSNAAFTRAF